MQQEMVQQNRWQLLSRSPCRSSSLHSVIGIEANQYALSAMSIERRHWLSEALRKLAPEHEWLKFLAE